MASSGTAQKHSKYVLHIFLSFSAIVGFIVDWPDFFEKVVGLQYFDTLSQRHGLAIFVFVIFVLLIIIAWKKLRAKVTPNDILKYYNDDYVKSLKKTYIKTHLSSQFIADQETNYSEFTNTENIDAIDFILNQLSSQNPCKKYHLILGDIGAGKTTFLINLRIALAKINNYQAYYIPLAEDDSLSLINSIENKENSILLLDALDENKEIYNDYEDKIIQLTKALKEFKLAVLTCRTQFFPSETEELKNTDIRKYDKEKGFHFFEKKYITPFDNAEVELFLNHKFPLRLIKLKNRKKYDEALNLVKNIPSLMSRPLLLSYIEDLILVNITEIKNISNLYNVLIQNWLRRESEQFPEKESMYDELFVFSLSLSLLLFERFKSNKSTRVSKESAEEIAKELGLNLNLLDITSRSLLNRNSNGDYGFSHRSITEYLVAYYHFYNQSFFDVPLNERNVHKFMADLVISEGEFKHAPEKEQYTLFDFDVGLVKEYAIRPKSVPILTLSMTFSTVQQIIKNFSNYPAFPIEVMKEIDSKVINKQTIDLYIDKNPHKCVGDYFSDYYNPDDVEEDFKFIPELARLEDLIKYYLPCKEGMLPMVDEYGEVSGYLYIHIALEQFAKKLNLSIQENKYIESAKNIAKKKI